MLSFYRDPLLSKSRNRRNKLSSIELGLYTVTDSDIELIRAIKRGDIAEVERLIHAGANLNCTDTQQWTPLFHAASTGRTDIMRLLLDAGASPDAPEGDPLLRHVPGDWKHREEANTFLRSHHATPKA